jgi:hypothetical protein
MIESLIVDALLSGEKAPARTPAGGAPLLLLVLEGGSVSKTRNMRSPPPIFESLGADAYPLPRLPCAGPGSGVMNGHI